MKIKDAIYLAGGAGEVSRSLGLSRGALHKWLVNNRLPSSEFTGETKYAVTIAALINEKNIPGIKVTPLDICPGAGQYMTQAEAL